MQEQNRHDCFCEPNQPQEIEIQKNQKYGKNEVTLYIFLLLSKTIPPKIDLVGLGL